MTEITMSEPVMSKTVMSKSLMPTPEMDAKALDRLTVLHVKRFPDLPYIGQLARPTINATLVLSACLWMEAVFCTAKVYHIPDLTLPEFRDVVSVPA